MKKLLTTVAALVLVTGCTGTQPPPPCLAAHGSYAVEYTLTSAAPPAGSLCEIAVGIMGVEKYNQSDGGLPTLGLRPLELADGLPESIAIGTYTSKTPDADSLCHVDTFLNNAVSGTVTYTYSNVEFYVDAHAPGTQMKFDVTVTDSADGCTASYSATGVWPVVACADPPAVAPADENCAWVDGYWSGAALNPDFDVKCAVDPIDWTGAGAICVLRSQTLPSFCPTDGCSWRPEE